jgi:ATP-dependent protease ClpP protease subunit
VFKTKPGNKNHLTMNVISMQTKKELNVSDKSAPAGLEQHLAEVKKVMKVKGKNELIKIIGALLVDNHLLNQAMGKNPDAIKARRKQGWKMFAVGLVAGLLLASGIAKADQIKLDSKNTVVFRGEVSSASVTRAQLALAAAVKSQVLGSKIYLVLDTPGGDIAAGESFIAYAKQIRNLETISLFAASMGSAIVQALPGKRHVTPTGTLMFHRAAIQLSGTVESGEVESQLAYFKEMILGMETRNAARMKISIAAYKEKVKDEWWMYGDAAVKSGAADVVSTITCSRELVEARETLTIEGFMGSLTLVFSKCPLFQYPLSVKAE